MRFNAIRGATPRSRPCAYRLSILCAASLCCILVALPAYPPRDNSTMGQGQSSSKKLGRTSSKQLPPQDLADSLARTSIADRDAAAGHPPPPDALSPGFALAQTVSRAESAAGGFQILDVDNMIQRLLEAGYSGKVTKSPPLKNAEITSVCAAAREVFLSQPTLIELSPPVKIVGDVHGQVRPRFCA